MVLEKQLESKLITETKARGGLSYKFISPGMSGVPDRLVLMPGGRAAFIEAKMKGEKMRPQQIKRKEQLERLGFRVYLLDDKAQIGGILDEITKG